MLNLGGFSIQFLEWVIIEWLLWEIEFGTMDMGLLWFDGSGVEDDVVIVGAT